MYRNPEERTLVNRVVSEQQELIRAWGTEKLDRSESYTRRLREVFASALELKSYRDILDSHGLREPEGLLSGDMGYQQMMRQLPIIAKPENRKISEEVLSVRRNEFLNYFESSGTTDVPVPAPKALRDYVINTVNFGEHWAEFLGEDDVALILINTPQGPAAAQFEHALNYLGVLTFRTWVDTLRNDYGRIISIARSIQPTVFAGPPSQLINMYEFASNGDLYRPSFEKVLLTGERASPALRARIAKLTGGLVYDASYGSTETGTTAVAVSGSCLKLQSHSYIFEVQPNGGKPTPVTSGLSIEGELIVTALENKTRPLIRYKTGDRVRIEPEGGHAHSITPLGRLGDGVRFADLDMDQDEFEMLVWDKGEQSRIFNYFVAFNEDHVYFVFTGDYGDVSDARPHLRGLISAIPDVKIRLTSKLPEITGLGSTLGWKTARVHDLRVASEPLPEHIARAKDRMRDFIMSLG